LVEQLWSGLSNELFDTLRRYTAFQVVGGWANTGFSLVDQNLVPFQTAYPLLIFMVWLALAGNTAFVSALVLDFPIYDQN
jgi:Trk-type K+ transport system membrane component